MKKLLATLGTIIISGNGISGIVGNAPAPAKTEINSLQTNNLKRIKRQFNYNRNQLETYEPAFSSETLYFFSCLIFLKKLLNFTILLTVKMIFHYS